MSFTFKSIALLLALALTIGACSKEEALDHQDITQTETTKQEDGPKVELGLTLSAALNNGASSSNSDEGLRAMGNLQMLHGRFRPGVTDNKVNILVLVGSTTASTIPIAIQQREFTYLPDSRSLRYQGSISVDARLLQGAAKSGLKMMLIAAPEGSYDSQNKKINMSARFATKENMEAGNGFIVPYFSDWVDISNYIVSGQYIDLVSEDRPDENKIILKPQGQLIRIDLQDTQRIVTGTRVNTIILESNIMSRQGAYSLPASASATPTWVSDATFDANSKFAVSHAHPNRNSVYKFDLPLPAETEFTNTRTYYTWAEARPNVPNPYTRSYLRVKVTNPILTLTYTGTPNWWDGQNGERVVVVGYSNNNLTASGSTMSLNYGRQQAATTISRFTPTYVAKEASSTTVPASNAIPFNVMAFSDRQVSGSTRYTWQFLANNGWIGSNVNPITLNSSPNATDQNKEWRIPTKDELTNILPYRNASQTRPSTAWFNLGTVNLSQTGNYQQEVVVLGGKGATAKQYGAFFTRPTNSVEVYGLRFIAVHKGQGLHTAGMEINHNRNATFFKYNLLAKHDRVTEAIQVQAAYIGEYFPEIVNSIDGFRPYVEFFKQFLTPDERVLSVPLGEKDARTDYTGPTIWIDAPVANGTGQAFYRWNLTTGETSEVAVPSNNLNSRVASLLLIRDL